MLLTQTCHSYDAFMSAWIM